MVCLLSSRWTALASACCVILASFVTSHVLALLGGPLRAGKLFRELPRPFTRVVAPLYVDGRGIPRLDRPQREGELPLGNPDPSRVGQFPARPGAQQHYLVPALGRLGEKVPLQDITVQRGAFLEQH